MAKPTKKHPDSDLIDRLGGTGRAAEFFDVSPPSVSGWRITGLPKARRMYLRAVRPDLLATPTTTSTTTLIPGRPIDGAVVRETVDKTRRVGDRKSSYK